MDLLDAIAAHGLLLLQDKQLLNAVTLITGEHPRGSWWSHPKSHDIFRALRALPEDQVLDTKLVGGKVTFIHRRLWPDFLAVADGEREYEVHTESGRHEKRREPWSAWAKRMRVRATPDVAAARRRLEQAVIAIGGTPSLLPWSATRRGRSSSAPRPR